MIRLDRYLRSGNCRTYRSWLGAHLPLTSRTDFFLLETSTTINASDLKSLSYGSEVERDDDSSNEWQWISFALRPLEAGPCHCNDPDQTLLERTLESRMSLSLCIVVLFFSNLSCLMAKSPPPTFQPATGWTTIRLSEQTTLAEAARQLEERPIVACCIKTPAVPRYHGVADHIGSHTPQVPGGGLRLDGEVERKQTRSR